MKKKAPKLSSSRCLSLQLKGIQFLSAGWRILTTRMRVIFGGDGFTGWGLGFGSSSGFRERCLGYIENVLYVYVHTCSIFEIFCEDADKVTALCAAPLANAKQILHCKIRATFRDLESFASL